MLRKFKHFIDCKLIIPKIRCKYSNIASFDVHRVLVQTNKFWEESQDTMTFDVGYIDTAHNLMKSQKSRIPTVMMFHGTPETHESLINLIEPLVDNGFRVLVPNFPGIGVTFGTHPSYDDMFAHSPMEKLDFIVSFMNKIGITRLDLMMGHSAGCLPMWLLYRKMQLGCKLAIGICPVPGHTTVRSMQPYFLLKFLNNIWDTHRPLTKLFLKLYSYRKKNNFSNYSVEKIIRAIQTGANVDRPHQSLNAKLIAQEKLPILYVYSDNDPLVESKKQEEFSTLLGCNKKYKLFKKDDLEKVQKNAHYLVDSKVNELIQNNHSSLIVQSKNHLPFRNPNLANILVNLTVNIYNRLNKVS
ncbi:hypothetical protein A3Q56_05864 [Intoshia linei]|uniref:AB hydrolase-1 domain-containing protein n=1 Tax=Intoshia linei TaxID=1819745 RepID=A0A177AWL2_9BILA|nr:hypothetical protein A3Q56_05864 [Intoshia linei]